MNGEKQIITIKLDYLQGPIWISDMETGEPLTGINLIDDDVILCDLNHKVAQLYNSYYEFDSHNQACWFNAEKEAAERRVMLDLISQLLARLEEVNDGSFEVRDYVSSQLNVTK